MVVAVEASLSSARTSNEENAQTHDAITAVGVLRLRDDRFAILTAPLSMTSGTVLAKS
jgi:hypothetical protein